MGMMMTDNAKCQNTACDCPVVDEGAFCSEYCRNTADTQESEGPVCDCEHSSCRVGDMPLNKSQRPLGTHPESESPRSLWK
jgi:hypothetical protein